jgi:2-oxoglutarate ferredoxin oxidoreductase subunit gamma
MMAQQAETAGQPAATNDEHRLIVAGFGGQGVLSLGKILCISAMAEGQTVTYLPSYGAEVRGGTANCQVTISSHTIYSPLVELADSLIIMNQLSYDRFADRVRKGGLTVVNSSAVNVQEGPANGRVISLPATERAAEMGSVRVANVIMLGAFLATVPLVEWESCRRAMAELWGERKADLVELNARALELGAGMSR